MQSLRTRVYEAKLREEEEKLGTERRNKIGSGDRAEKIRTYNFPQNRVTDHRIGLTIQQLDRIMEGKLEPIIDALINEDQRLKLLGEEEYMLLGELLKHAHDLIDDPHTNILKDSMKISRRCLLSTIVEEGRAC